MKNKIARMMNVFINLTEEEQAEAIKAMEKYKELITTPEQRMLHDAIEMANNLSKHIRELNFNDKNEKGDFHIVSSLGLVFKFQQ